MECGSIKRRDSELLDPDRRRAPRPRNLSKMLADDDVELVRVEEVGVKSGELVPEGEEERARVATV
jgi:hypothetical protein